MKSGSSSSLESAILKTVAWFLLFDYPLTAFEIWRWLYSPNQKFSLFEVEEVLNGRLCRFGRVCQQDGFYSLGGHDLDWLIKNRQANFLDASRKFKKLRRATQFFSLLPFVHAVFACNSLSWFNTNSKSDIDLLIVVRPGTIWLTRLLVVLPFAILKKRPASPHPATTEVETKSFLNFFRVKGTRSPIDPFCFSVFVSSDNLSFDELCLKPQDPGLVYWIGSFLPIFDRDNIQEKIQKENHLPLPHVSFKKVHPSLEAKNFSLPISWFRIFERLVKKTQTNFLPIQLKVLMNKDSRVVVSDQMLKFHSNDNREACRDKWQKILVGYL